MENIISGFIALLWRLTTSRRNLIAFVSELLARQPFRLARLLELTIAVILWSVPLTFWTVVIHFVVKHW